jgi:hypothetical protein
VLGPRLLPALGLLLAGTLSVLAHAPPPEVHPRDAALYEGQGAIQVTGTVVRARDGTVWLARDGVELAVRAAEVPVGAQATATGRVLRLGGSLVLWADALDVDAAAPTALPEPGWHALAADPDAWAGRPVVLAGVVQGDQLRDQEGHRIRLAGAAPAGPFRGAGLVRYAPACLCHTFAPVP